ncbi:O-antigen ligase family protein [Streptomyces sp. NPDC051776]|uniref:O-antigen ligase family protein n=1 Tax=Streptomyces sp. NPDC051776 TaxID=3155414 RepID=UPI0034349E58
MATAWITFRHTHGRIRPAWCALPAAASVLLLCMPVGPDDGTVTLADAASAVLVAVCAISLLWDRRRTLTPAGVAILSAPMIGFAVATAASRDPMASLPGFVRYAQVFVLVPAAMVLLLRSRRDFLWVGGAVLATALAQGAVGVHQYLTGTGASYAGQDIRAVGTFGPVDVMGMATVVAFGTVLALALGLGAPADTPRRLRIAALACAGVLLVPLVFSFSRGSWLATAVAAAVVLLLVGLRIAMSALAVFVASLVVLVGGVGVGSALISERLTSMTQVAGAPDRSVTDRYALWDAAVSIWEDDPVTGVGIKGFPVHRDANASLGLSSSSDTAGAGHEFRREPLLSPHNMYLLVLSEQGLIGITAVAGSWSALLVLAYRRLRSVRRAGLPWECGLASVGLLVYLLSDFLYGDIGGPSTVLIAVMLGLAAWWALSPAAVAQLPASPVRGLFPAPSAWAAVELRAPSATAPALPPNVGPSAPLGAEQAIPAEAASVVPAVPVVRAPAVPPAPRARGGGRARASWARRRSGTPSGAVPVMKAVPAKPDGPGPDAPADRR